MKHKFCPCTWTSTWEIWGRRCFPLQLILTSVTAVHRPLPRRLCQQKATVWPRRTRSEPREHGSLQPHALEEQKSIRCPAAAGSRAAVAGIGRRAEGMESNTERFRPSRPHQHPPKPSGSSQPVLLFTPASVSAGKGPLTAPLSFYFPFISSLYS